MRIFEESKLAKLYKPPFASSKNENGLVTIIGGSSLFHGAPLLALKTASRIVDMVFFSSPEPNLGEVANKMKSSFAIKSKLLSFIWVPWDEIEEYIKKSDAVLIGPGLMRYRKEEGDVAWQETRDMTKELLLKYPEKKWVIDAGSLQTLDVAWIPKNAILTPNQKEYKMIFGDTAPERAAREFNCTIVVKGPSTFVYSPNETVEVRGGNPGLTKGGTGDVQAGLTVAFFAKNEAVLAASSAAYIIKKSADELFKKVGTIYNSDDLAEKIPSLFSPHNLR